VQLPSHVHIGGIQFAILGLQILIWLFVFRALETLLADTPIGRALAFIH
jgi:hypothetical protein